MSRRLGTLTFGTLVLLTLSHVGGAFLPRSEVTLTIDVAVNPVEGPPLSTCEVSETISAYRKDERRITHHETIQAHRRSFVCIRISVCLKRREP